MPGKLESARRGS